MCTAVLSIEPGHPVLLAGIRDEFTDRAWKGPGRHWPQYPGVIGGKDLQGGGTWLAVSPQDRRVACVLNGRGRPALPKTRRSRGLLPLRSAAGETLDQAMLACFDPFHLVSAEPGHAMLQTWDGERLTERPLPPGLHFVVNSGLSPSPQDPGEPGPAGDRTAPSPNGRDQENARIAHFLPLFRAASRPAPRLGGPTSDAWGEWLPIAEGAGLGRDDPRALILRRETGDRRTWGTTSVSLVALAPDEVRFDFSGAPGNPAAWYRVPGARVYSPW